jgi:glutathione S-transferase
MKPQAVKRPNRSANDDKRPTPGGLECGNHGGTRGVGVKDMTGSARMKLFSGPLSMFGAKAQIAALEKGFDFELVMVPFEMKRLYQPKHPEVARVNPKQQVPVLLHGDVEIFDSTQIFEYFEHLQPQPPLWPADPAERARARLLELKSDEVYFPPIIRLMGLQETPSDPAAVAARDAAARHYDEMEAMLREREFLAGAYSYADIAFYMAQLFGARMGAPMADAHPRLRQWRDRMTARPAVRQVAAAMAVYLVSQGRPLPDFMTTLR